MPGWDSGPARLAAQMATRSLSCFSSVGVGNEVVGESRVKGGKINESTRYQQGKATKELSRDTQKSQKKKNRKKGLGICQNVGSGAEEPVVTKNKEQRMEERDGKGVG